MKKTIPAICLTLATVMTFSSLATAAASAAERTDYEKKECSDLFLQHGKKRDDRMCVF